MLIPQDHINHDQHVSAREEHLRETRRRVLYTRMQRERRTGGRVMGYC